MSRELRVRSASSHRVGPGQILAAERRRADALAGRVVDRIGDGRRRRRAGRLAETTPFSTAGRGKDRLDLRNLIDAEQVVGIEVGVDEASLFELEAAGPGMNTTANFLSCTGMSP